MTTPNRPIVLITGSNQGIGLTTAQILARKHAYHVIIGSRDISAGEKVAAALKDEGHSASNVQLDLTSPTSIENAVKTIESQFGYLDVLINNAGVLLDLNPNPSIWDLYNKTFATNVIGTGILTESLLPLLRQAKRGPPRIIFVSSGMGSLQFATQKDFEFYNLESKVYDASKAAVNMLMLNYSRIMSDSANGRVGKVNSVCPGVVATKLTQGRGHSTEVGASRIVEMATSDDEDGPTGTFSNKDGPMPW